MGSPPPFTGNLVSTSVLYVSIFMSHASLLNTFSSVMLFFTKFPSQLKLSPLIFAIENVIYELLEISNNKQLRTNFFLSTSEKWISLTKKLIVFIQRLYKLSLINQISYFLKVTSILLLSQINYIEKTENIIIK